MKTESNVGARLSNVCKDPSTQLQGEQVGGLCTVLECNALDWLLII
jgi:hypothetical protein